MADDPLDGKEVLTGLIEGVLSDMTGKQFAALAERTGHVEVDPKEAAAQALAERVRAGNLVPDGATFGQVTAALRRRGFGK